MLRSRVPSTARSLVAVARTEQLGFLAAAIAYYAFVSVIPLLLVTIAVASAVAGPAFAARVLVLVGDILSPQSTIILEEALTSGAGRGSATVVGIVVLTWSSLRVLRGLDHAFARIYGVSNPQSFLLTVRDALVVFVAIGAAVAAVVVVGAVLPVIGVTPGSPLDTVWLAAVLPFVFLPLYYVFPDCPVAVREAVPGAVFAGIGWTVLGVAFGVYAATAASFQLYGVLGGALLALTWFYFAGLLLLGGAVLNTVFAGHRDRQVQQEGLRDVSQARMSDTDGPDGGADPEREPEASDADGAGDRRVDTVEGRVEYADIAELRRELDRLEADIEDRTVHREDLESDLKRYVRRRVRRGKARGWGPYLVLLYGTVMTLGAFVFLNGAWAILAMIVVWLSTLGLYTLMVLVGVTLTVAGLPGRLRDAVGDLRD